MINNTHVLIAHLVPKDEVSKFEAIEFQGVVKVWAEPLRIDPDFSYERMKVSGDSMAIAMFRAIERQPETYGPVVERQAHKEWKEANGQAGL